MKTIRVGFVGTGGIARTHARALKKLPGVEIVAAVGGRVASAEAFLGEVGDSRAKAFADVDAMLAAGPLDAAYVCIPPGAHHGQTETLAERGVHLMLEKPIALTADRAASIEAAVKKAGVLCQIGFHMRHASPARRLKQLIADGSAGRPLFMQGRFFINALFPAWWRDPQIGGGQLLEQAIHIYDLARFYFGEAKAISAQMDNLNHARFPDYRVDDVSASTIRFHNGAIANLCATNCAEPQTFSAAYTVQCEKVVGDFSGPDVGVIALTGGRKSEEVARDHVSVVHETFAEEKVMYDRLTAEFIGAIRDGTPMSSSIEDGMRSLQLVLAAGTSAKAGGTLQTL